MLIAEITNDEEMVQGVDDVPAWFAATELYRSFNSQ